LGGDSRASGWPLCAATSGPRKFSSSPADDVAPSKNLITSLFGVRQPTYGREMSATLLNIAGPLMNLAGVILLFRYGMPYRVRSEGATYLVTEDVNKREIAMERRYDWLGKLGLVLIVLGTLAQIAGALLI
jgi:hypothetical protein